MPHNIDDLRDHLFGTLTALRDKDNPMPIDRAKAVADVAQTIINSAKVEVDMINAVGSKYMRPTEFLGVPVDPKQPAIEHAPQAKPGNGLPPRGPTAQL